MNKCRGRGCYIAGTASLCILVLGLLLDVWQVRGQIISRETRMPISNADVLISLRYHDREPLVPHGGTPKSRCVASVLARSSVDGSFSALRFSFSLPWKRKGIVVEVFEPGWHSDGPHRFDAQAGAIPHEPISVELEPDQRKRWSFVHDHEQTSPVTDDTASPLYQHTMSTALTRMANMAAGENACGHDGWLFASLVLRHVIAEAETLDEKRYIHLQCLGARNLLAARLSAHIAEVPFSEDLHAGTCGAVLNKMESL